MLPQVIGIGSWWGHSFVDGLTPRADFTLRGELGLIL